MRAWESGARMASLEALGILGEVLDAPWLSGVYLREQSTALNGLLPDFEVDRPLAEAAAEYVSCILELVDTRVDRALLRMVADGQIDQVELPVFEALMDLAAGQTKPTMRSDLRREGALRKRDVSKLDTISVNRKEE